MDNAVDSNKRLARNTLILYVRMGVMMVIGFFTARITLSALGVENYGIYNVVGGLVSMFSLISTSLSSSIARFLTYGLGKGDMTELRRVYSVSLAIQIILALVIVACAETVGLWFLNHKLVIPPDRMYAANVVFQLSLLSFVMSLLSTPFNAMIIAHEKMSAFAYMTLFEAGVKLLIVIVLLYVPGDKLILYAILLSFMGLATLALYCWYCRSRFEECRFMVVRDRNMYGRIFSFAGWNFIGCTAALMNDQGINIMLNMFFGPIVNTGRGIGNQINAILSQFSGNFMTALNPQITKNFAGNNFERTYTLIFKGTKLSYFLFLIISIPVLLETPRVLAIWLGQIPDYSVGFARLTIILSLVNSLSNTLINAQLATGRIRNYQIVVGGTLLLNLPVSYLFLRAGCAPAVTVAVAIFISQICMFLRLWFLRSMMGLPMRAFIREVYLRVLMVTALSLLLPAAAYIFMDSSLMRFMVISVLAFVSTVVTAWFVGCDASERAMLRNAFHQIRQKLLRS